MQHSARTAPAAIDRYLLSQSAQQQTRGHRCCCQSIGQTDGRTPDRYIDPSPHMRVVSVFSNATKHEQTMLIVVTIRSDYAVPLRPVIYTRGRGLGERSIVSSALFVCLSVHEHISRTTRPIFTNFVHVIYGRGLVLIWRRCDALYVLPVLCMTSYLHTIASDRRRENGAYSR